MVMSVTPMVCITLAFWLGRSGLIASGGCCADTYGAAQVNANRIAKVKRENRFKEIMLALLIVEFGALSNAAEVNGKYGSDARPRGRAETHSPPSAATADSPQGHRERVMLG